MERCRRTCGFTSPLVLFLVCLLAAPMLTAVALTWEEGYLADKMLLRVRARHLAEYGFWDWLARADQGQQGYAPPSGGRFSDEVGWRSLPAPGFLGGGDFRVSAGFRQDSDDLDGSAATPLVLYDRAFGFTSSPFESGGYPILEVRASGQVGLHREDLMVSLTYLRFLPPETAALTLGGPALLAGPALISGSPHLADGSAAGPAHEGIPAILCRGELQTEGGVSLEGGSAADSPQPSWRDRLRSPQLLLGLPADSRYLEKRSFRGGARLPWDGVTVFPDGYRGQVRGQGVLVVHNPRFDPVRYGASIDVSLGIPAAGYDPAYSHLDPVNRPSILQPEGDSRFTGVIIADELAGGSGSLDVTGQVFQLTPERTCFGMNLGMHIRYSREAVRAYVHGACDEIIAWVRETGNGITAPSARP